MDMKWGLLIGGAVAAVGTVAYLATRPVATSGKTGVGAPPSLAAAGRATWIGWHQAARSYNPVNAAAFRRLIDTDIRNLPCQVCIDHGLAYVEENPVDLSSRTGLQRWLCEFHNTVNARLGKPLYDCRLER